MEMVAVAGVDLVIEVIRGPATSEEVVTRVLALLRDVGKQPAEVADRAGFVSNRLQMALLREALAIVGDVGVYETLERDRRYAALAKLLDEP